MPQERAADALQRTLAAIPPASGAVVMGTGIVSIDLSLAGHETLSRILLVVAAMAWIALGLLLAGRVLRDRERAHQEARSPAALTGVAGTAVLGTRLTLLGWSWAGIALLAIAFGFWLVLLAPVLSHWVTPTVGVSLVLTVSTESLAVLAAALAARENASWLLGAALAPFLLGLAFYVFVIARFDMHQLVVGHGDHWITGGALAISTLAAGRITLAATGLGALGGIAGTLEDASLALWWLTIAWLPALLVAEVWRPRLRYDVRRWSTVFPVGMYAACSFVVGSAAHAPAITHFARVWVWAGVAVWLIAFAAMLRRALQLAGGDHQPLSSHRIEELAPSQSRTAGRVVSRFLRPVHVRWHWSGSDDDEAPE
ncbi:MAG: tellurite resistance/C4-dicarboxylate transporter family protein [Solirubrobacteraceae bacterium]